MLHIDYSLVQEENIEKRKKFKELHEQGVETDKIARLLDEMAHHHHAIPLWQKIIFPIWLWKSLMHDKHEAFRFKYDTVAIQNVED